METLERSSRWRDGVVSVGLMGIVAAGIWLAVGADPAAGHSGTDECLPVCHGCAEVAGRSKSHGPGLKPMASHCVPGCSLCRETKAASRRLEHVLVSSGGMEPD